MRAFSMCELHRTPRANATGTAILLSHGQHDAMVEDIIIFSGMVGVRSENGANRILGVHAWNLAGAKMWSTKCGRPPK
mgnify:CR=1 FL=1